MKKLVDIAKDLHITPQAIYKRKGQDKELSARILGGTVKRGKNTYLNDDAVSAIMEAFSVGTEAQPDSPVEPEQPTIIMVLREQLAEKDRQIQTLQMLLSQQQQLTLKTQLFLEAPKKKLWDYFKKD